MREACAWPARAAADGASVSAAVISTNRRYLWCLTTRQAEIGAEVRAWSLAAPHAPCGWCHRLECDARGLDVHGGQMYVAAADGSVHRLSELGAQSQRFEAGGGALHALVVESATRAAWSADGTTASARGAALLTAADDGAVRAYDLPLRGAGPPGGPATLTPRRVMEGHAGAVRALAVASIARAPGAAGRVVLGGGDDSHVGIWSLRDGVGFGASRGRVAAGAPVVALRSAADGLAAAALSTGAVMLVRAADGCAADDATWTAASTWQASAGVHVDSLGLYASALLATTSDGCLRVWPLGGIGPNSPANSPSHSPSASLPLPSRVRSLLCAESELLLGVADDGHILEWSASSSGPSPAAVSPPSAMIASAVPAGVAARTVWGPPLARVHGGAAGS